MFKKIFTKIKNKIQFIASLLFFGMKGANDVIFGNDTSSEGTTYERHDGSGGVFQDLLEEKLTQEVEETRDKYYRVYKEADKYDTSTITMESDDETGELRFFHTDRLGKKTLFDFQKRTSVYEEAENSVLLIQDNKHIDKYNSFDKMNIPNGLYDFDTTLQIKRDGITPRFEIEKFATKIVVRKGVMQNRDFVDIYLPMSASQFGKIDAMLIANLHRMMDEKNYRSDITDFLEIEWITDGAWGCDNICLFKYDDIKLVNITTFDGSFVLIFDCNVVNFAKYIPEKYITKGLDDKYKNKAPKGDIFALDANNFKTKTII